MTTPSWGAERLAERLASLIRLGRPKFLLGGLALYGLGALTARALGYGFDWGVYLLGQLAVSCIQLMTHYSNDYFDLAVDRVNHHRTRWSGGSGVLVREELPPRAALWAALGLAAIAAGATLVLALRPDMPFGLTVAVLATMLALAWSYSSPPLRLHSRGLGEPTVAVVVPFLTPLSGFVLQAKALRGLPVLLTLPLIALQLTMLLTLQIPDRAGDRRLGKKTWTVLFGAGPIAFACSALIVVAFAVGLSSPRWGAPASVSWAWLLLAPIGLWQLLSYARHDHEKPQRYERLTFGSVALFFLAVVANLLAVIAATDSLGDATGARAHAPGSTTEWNVASRAERPPASSALDRCGLEPSELHRSAWPARCWQGFPSPSAPTSENTTASGCGRTSSAIDVEHRPTVVRLRGPVVGRSRGALRELLGRWARPPFQLPQVCPALLMEAHQCAAG